MFDPRDLPDRCNTGYYVYALVDPETRKTRYIGYTSNPRKRWSLHCYRKGLPFNPALREWVIALWGQGKRPELQILVHFPERLWSADARATEREFIHWWSIFHAGDLLQKQYVVVPEMKSKTPAPERSGAIAVNQGEQK